MDNDQEKKELLRRYTEGKLSEQELRHFFDLVESGVFDEDYDLMMQEIQAWEEKDIQQDQTSFDRLGSRLQQSVKDKGLTGKTKLNYLMQVLSVAASLIFLAGGYYFYGRLNSLQTQQTFKTVRVPLGKLVEIHLTDGSKVTLTSGSVFKYPKKFTDSSREVYLSKGKAFFEVAPSKKVPFIVISGKLNTKALGTSFIVQNYSNYSWQKVSLYTGKVAIQEAKVPARPVYLNPGEDYRLNGVTGKKGTITNFQERVPFSLTGTLSFNETALHEALYSISSYYDVTISFDKELVKKARINGEFNNGSVEEVLHTIAFIHQLKVIKQQNGYKLISGQNNGA